MLKLALIISFVVMLILGLLAWAGVLPSNILQWPPLIIAGIAALLSTNISLPVWFLMLGSLLIWFSARQKLRGASIPSKALAESDNESESEAESVTESITQADGSPEKHLLREIESAPKVEDVSPQELRITDDEHRMLNLFMQTDEQFLQVHYLQQHLVVPIIRIEKILAALVEKQLLIASESDAGAAGYCLSQLGSDFVLGIDF